MEPQTVPATRPTPKFGGIALEATIQNRVSAYGFVYERLSNAIGSNSSYKIKPVPAHDNGISKPIMQANRSLINFGLVRLISKAQNKVSVTDKVTVIIKKYVEFVNLPVFNVIVFIKIIGSDMTPFKLAWATIPKIKSTIAALKLPVPANTVSRDTQPRVKNIPEPKSNPPKISASHGNSFWKKRCSLKLINPRNIISCVPANAVINADIQIAVS